MSLLKGLRRKLALSTARERQIWLLSACGAGLIGVLWVVSSVKPPAPKKLSDVTEGRVIAPPTKNIDMAAMSATLANVERRLNELQTRQNVADSVAKDASTRLNDKLLEVVNEKATSELVVKEIDKAVTDRVGKLVKDAKATNPLTEGRGGVLEVPVSNGQKPVAVSPSVDESQGAGTSPEEERRPKLRMTTADAPVGEGGSANGTKLDKPAKADTLAQSVGAERSNNAISRDTNGTRDNEGGQIWLPAGSILTGVMLTGVDAPTSQASQKNPTPMLIRIKHDAILPNYFKVDIKECFALASGYGQLSTERALMRTERLTCVRQDGQVVEVNLDGYITGEDGKVGMRGRLVTKEGAMIARTLSAGMLGALGERLSGTGKSGTGISVGTGGGLTVGGVGDSAASGIGTAFSKVADFYLDMAKETVPVIEVDAGRQVSIVLVRGVSIKNNRS